MDSTGREDDSPYKTLLSVLAMLNKTYKDMIFQYENYRFVDVAGILNIYKHLYTMLVFHMQNITQLNPVEIDQIKLFLASDAIAWDLFVFNTQFSQLCDSNLKYELWTQYSRIRNNVRDIARKANL